MVSIPDIKKTISKPYSKSSARKKVKNSVKYSIFLDLNFTKPRFFETQPVNL